MKANIMKKSIAVMTALLMAVSVFAYAPQKGAQVYAKWNDPAMVIGVGSVLATEPNTSNSQTVYFADHTWRVIGYDGSQIASVSGTATLLSSVNITTDVQFNTSIYGHPNHYDGSVLQEAIDQTVPEKEKTAIAPRQLESGSYNSQDPRAVDCIAGNTVNALLWPLSTKEAYNLAPDLFRVVPGDSGGLDTYWWLRSPGDGDYKASVAYGYNYVNAAGFHVVNKYGVRPAFHLDFGSVAFTSAAEGGKTSGDVGADALTPVGINGGNEWKLTVRSGHDGFAVDSVTTCDGDMLNIEYSGAATGDNEYISAVITGSDGSVRYYGRLQEVKGAAGKAHVRVVDKLGGGDTLYVFNEQYNGDKKTDYASALSEITIPPITDHNMTATAKQAAACTEDGNIDYWTCSNCEKAFSDEAGTHEVDITKAAAEGGVIIPAAGHTWKAATCTKPKTCKVCGATTGKAFGHSWDEGKITRQPTTTATGVKTYSCTACKTTKTETVAKLARQANTLKIKAKTAAVKGSTKGKKGRLKKTKTLKVGKVISFIDEGQGPRSYILVSAKKGSRSYKKYFRINTKNGSVTVKKGLRKGIYKVKTKVKAEGDTDYEPSALKTVTFTVRVR